MPPFPKPRPFPHPRPSRLPRRKRVTLIANFPASSGFAICADSQETITEYDPQMGSYEVRVTVQKIAPIKAGKYQIAICGGGHATLIESFIVRAERALLEEDKVTCSADRPAGVSAIHRRLEGELKKFYETDVKLCPDPDEAKKIKLFIAASCPIAQQCAVWVSENIVLRDARREEPELNGWEHNLYAETAKRLFRRDMTMNQAALASIYTVTIAKDTSNYVKDPFSVAIVNKDGIEIVDAGYIRAMEERLEEYEANINRIFLSCSDTTVSVPELETQMEEFKKSVLNLHREQIDQQATKTTLEVLLGNRGLRTLPKGPVYVTAAGELKVEHDRDKIAASRKRFEFLRIQANAGPIVLTVRCKCQKSFEVEFPDYQTAYGKAVRCECGEGKVITEIDPGDIRLKVPRPL